jgi:glutamate/tyrosine decarboxylase-like PLP-dependent enzyme
VQLRGLPEEARGALVTGATLANFTALAAARSRVLEAFGWDVERDGLFGAPAVRELAGRERHDTIDKALRLLGLGTRALRVVDADAQGRLSAAALRRELLRESAPTIVCAQAGNVNSGAFDPLPEIHAALTEHRSAQPEGGTWLHVDGAFGLWARAAPSHAALAAGVELADSWATDAHKFLNVPYDSGIVLTRQPRAHRRALAVHGAYLSSGSKSTQPNPGAFAPELSRRARGFVLWAALRQLGSSGVDALVTRSVSHAQRLARELCQTPGLRVLNDVVFNQVVLHAEPPPGREPETFTGDLVLAIQAEGTCYATPTLWRGSPALRFSVINADTTDADILRTAQAVQSTYLRSRDG